MEAHDSEEWDFYPCTIDGRPAAIRVDLGQARHAPREELPTLLFVSVPLRDPDERGFVRREEFDAVTALEGALRKSLAAGGARHVGCVTTDGARDFFFYAGGGRDWEMAVAESLTAFPDYAYSLQIRDDPEWRSYLEFLYPTRDDMNLIMNNRVLRQLAEQGDVAELPRPIDYFLYFPTREAAEAAARAAVAEGFSLAENGLAERDGSPPVWQVRLSRIDAPSEIDDITARLLELADEGDGEFDGWGCLVRRE